MSCHASHAIRLAANTIFQFEGKRKEREKERKEERREGGLVARVGFAPRDWQLLPLSHGAVVYLVEKRVAFQISLCCRDDVGIN